MESVKVPILGREYDVVFMNNAEMLEEVGVIDLYGLAKMRDGRVLINVEAHQSACGEACLDEIRDTLKHEFWHCLFYEAGLTDYSIDEKLVEFLSKKFDDMIELNRIASEVMEVEK